MSKKSKTHMSDSMPQIEELPVDAIKPYEKNPRINDNAVPKVAASLRDFGWQQPIVIDKDGVIVAGHTRYLAALSLKMTHVPCVRASKLTPSQVNAYRLVDNKTNEFAVWDIEMLDGEIEALPEFDMSQYGFGLSDDANGVLDVLSDDDKDESLSDDMEDSEVSKVSIEIPKKHYERFRLWWSNGGKQITTNFALTKSGCEDLEYDGEVTEEDKDDGTEQDD